MNKRFFLNILVLLFSFSALAMQPNARRNNAKRTPIATRIKKETPAKTQVNDITFDEQDKQIEKPTIGDSWSKVIRLKWTSLSKDDAWNIGATLVTCGVIIYLYNHMPKNPMPNNAVNAPHDDQGPDNANKNIRKPKPQNGNNPLPTTLGDEEKECELCGEYKKGHEFCTLSCCEYNATCSDCLAKMMNIALKEKTTAELKCPNRNCGEPISEQDIRNITNSQPDMKSDYDDVTIKEYLEKNDAKHCPTPDCPYAFINDEQIQDSITCPTCKKTYCSNCLVEHSMEKTCEQAKADLKLKANKSKEEQETEEWLKNNAKACPQCKTLVEKDGGCLCMLCTRCQHQFCWQCLKPHDHTMNHACGLWDNDAAMNQANQDLIGGFMGQGMQGGQQQFNNQPNGININGDNFINHIFNNWMHGMFNDPWANMGNNHMNGPMMGIPNQQQPNNQQNIFINGQRVNAPNQQQPNNQQNVFVNGQHVLVNGQRVDMPAQQQQNNHANVGNVAQNNRNRNNNNPVRNNRNR